MRRLIPLLLLLVVTQAAPASAAGNQAPTAVSSGPATAQPGAPVTFSGASSSDPDGQIVAWRWRLNGGSTWQFGGPSVTLRDLPVGRHTIQLVVVDDAGAESLADERILIVADTIAPTAVLDVPDSPAASSVRIDGSRSSDVGTGIAEYRFSIDEGAEIVSADPVITRTLAAGARTIRLVVVDRSGNVSQPTRVKVTVAGNPTAVLNGPDRVSVTASTVTLTADKSFGDAPIKSYRWTVDGTVTETRDPSLTIPRPALGAHDATLVVTDSLGNQSLADARRFFVVDDQRPTAVLSAPTSVLAGAAIPLDGARSTDIGGRVVSYTWVVAGRPAVQTPDATFRAPGVSTPGVITASLIVVDSSGNESLADQRTITVLPPEKVLTTSKATSISLFAPIGKRTAQIDRSTGRLLAGRVFTPEAGALTATFRLRRGGRTLRLLQVTVRVPAGGITRLEGTLGRAALRALGGQRTVTLSMRLALQRDGDAEPVQSTESVAFSVR